MAGNTEQITRAFRRAISQPDKWVVKIEYEDRFKDVTSRTISPIRFLGGGRVLALCLGREEVRMFLVDQVQSAVLADASDALMPEPIDLKPD